MQVIKAHLKADCGILNEGFFVQVRCASPMRVDFLCSPDYPFVEVNPATLRYWG